MGLNSEEWKFSERERGRGGWVRIFGGGPDWPIRCLLLFISFVVFY